MMSGALHYTMTHATGRDDGTRSMHLRNKPNEQRAGKQNAKDIMEREHARIP